MLQWNFELQLHQSGPHKPVATVGRLRGLTCRYGSRLSDIGAHLTEAKCFSGILELQLKRA
jgi:hypothetical protein